MMLWAKASGRRRQRGTILPVVYDLAHRGGIELCTPKLALQEDTCAETKRPTAPAFHWEAWRGYNHTLPKSRLPKRLNSRGMFFSLLPEQRQPDGFQLGRKR